MPDPSRMPSAPVASRPARGREICGPSHQIRHNMQSLALHTCSTLGGKVMRAHSACGFILAVARPSGRAGDRGPGTP
jgi:hypothetical protein